MCSCDARDPRAPDDDGAEMALVEERWRAERLPHFRQMLAAHGPGARLAWYREYGDGVAKYEVVRPGFPVPLSLNLQERPRRDRRGRYQLVGFLNVETGVIEPATELAPA